MMPDPEGRARRHRMIDRAVRKFRASLPRYAQGLRVTHNGDHVLLVALPYHGPPIERTLSTDWLLSLDNRTMYLAADTILRTNFPAMYNRMTVR